MVQLFGDMIILTLKAFSNGADMLLRTMKNVQKIVDPGIDTLENTLYTGSSPLEQDRVYICRAGDTLKALGIQFYQNAEAWAAIWLATNDKAVKDPSFDTIQNPTVVPTGQKLLLPDAGAIDGFLKKYIETYSGVKGVVPLQLNTEYPKSDENQAIEKLIQIGREAVQSAHEQGQRPVGRDAHMKSHGCVHANFVVNDLPDTFRHGVFKEPQTFSAWIRFSNSNRTIERDSVPDLRGMSVKLMGVGGKKLLVAEENATTHDFIMINQPVFIVRCLADYFRLFQLTKAGKSTLEASAIVLGKPFKDLASNAQPPVIASPFDTTYFSTTPYLLGKRAMKFRARPENLQKRPLPESPGPDHLREALSRHLATQGMRFSFDIQFQEDPYAQPIEDSTVEWTTPFTNIATIEIPPQEFESSAQIEFDQNLSFNPWHVLPEHHPLGAINRGRRAIYRSISELRHQLNNVPLREPTKNTIFEFK